jgi:hypothetical protein
MQYNTAKILPKRKGIIIRKLNWLICSPVYQKINQQKLISLHNKKATTFAGHGFFLFHPR